MTKKTGKRKSPLALLRDAVQTAGRARVTTGYASCTMVSTSPGICPLCRVAVPANTIHSCERKPQTVVLP